MFKPCPNCGFLVALIAGREASQRCPRCGSAMLEDGEAPPLDDVPVRRASDRRPTPAAPGDARHAAAPADGAATSGADGDALFDGDDAAAGGEASDPAQRNGVADVAAAANTEPAPDAPATAATGGAEAQAPSFAARRAARRAARGRRWPWAIALPVLALLLAVQLLLSQRVELARDARWRPVLVTACGLLGCEVPAWREPAAFAMLARNVRPDASRPGVLHVSTSLRNDARWPQPLPVVVLSLSDVDGRVLAARAVAPAEYGRPGSALVAPGDSVDIAFDVREPSPRVVSFDFRLR